MSTYDNAAPLPDWQPEPHPNPFDFHFGLSRVEEDLSIPVNITLGSE